MRERRTIPILFACAKLTGKAMQSRRMTAPGEAARVRAAMRAPTSAATQCGPIRGNASAAPISAGEAIAGEAQDESGLAEEVPEHRRLARGGLPRGLSLLGGGAQ